MYFIIYGSLYLFSLLPFFILYGISDFACFIMYRVAGYRKKIVLVNLRIAFPEKTEQERKQIAKAFYRNLVDTFIETIKLLSISEKEFNKRAIAEWDEILALEAKGVNIQFQSGHQMNWEYVNWAVSKKMNIPFIGIYMQIGNASIDRLFYNLRSKFGTVLVSAGEFRSRMHKIFNQQYSLALAADQNPWNPQNSYWLYFFSKPAPFVTGPDTGARKNKSALVFVKFIKTKRGHYQFKPTIIVEDASIMKPGEITHLYRDYLEYTIREHPDNYLWSHRRWKIDYKEEYRKNWIDQVAPPAETNT